MNFNDLEFETHKQHYENVLRVNLDDLSQNESRAHSARYAMAQALRAHSIAVHDPLRDLFSDAVRCSSSLHNKNAIYYMHYGAGRRLNMIFYGYNKIVWNAPVDRRNPLSREEQNLFNAALNTIYMHLLGVLDNFVWTVLHEKEEAASPTVKAKDVYIFSKTLDRLGSFQELHRQLLQFRPWAKDVKSRRNPVAHRIPLQILQAVLNSEEAEEYNVLTNQYYEAMSALDFDSVDMVQKKMESLGNFWPCFTHHPDEGIVQLYPTLPTDMANLVRIGGDVIDFLIQA